MFRGFNVNWNVVIAIIGLMLTVLGWHISNVYQYRHEVENKKRDKVVDYLIISYFRIADACNRDVAKESESERRYNLERALEDIQLFGSERQIELAKLAYKGFVLDKSTSMDNLLQDLRNSLREELGLERVNDTTFTHFRFITRNSSDLERSWLKDTLK